jgi:hypothetical protein
MWTTDVSGAADLIDVADTRLPRADALRLGRVLRALADAGLIDECPVFVFAGPNQSERDPSRPRCPGSPRNALSATSHSCNCSRRPRAATKPSRDIVMFTRSLLIGSPPGAVDLDGLTGF